MLLPQNHPFTPTGDFNTKIGNYIEGSKNEVSKFGKKLLGLLKNEDIEILNTHENCEELWTRIEGNTLTK